MIIRMKHLKSSVPASHHEINAAAAALPQVGTLRWTAVKKSAVISALRLGAITAVDARDRYMISYEELAVWEAAFDHRGTGGLYAKSLRYRRPNYHDLAAALTR